MSIKEKRLNRDGSQSKTLGQIKDKISIDQEMFMNENASQSVLSNYESHQKKMLKYDQKKDLDTITNNSNYKIKYQHSLTVMEKNNRNKKLGSIGGSNNEETAIYGTQSINKISSEYKQSKKRIGIKPMSNLGSSKNTGLIISSGIVSSTN